MKNRGLMLLARRLWALVIGLAVGAPMAPAQTSHTPNSPVMLPTALRQALSHAQCRLPQFPLGAVTIDSRAVAQHVVYRAAVRTAGVVDWVILCERNQQREVLVFPESVTSSTRPVLRLPMAWDPGEEGCDGWLGIADSTWVRAALRRERLVKASPALVEATKAKLVHEGILNNICESGTKIVYWTGQKWLRVPAYHDE